MSIDNDMGSQLREVMQRRGIKMPTPEELAEHRKRIAEEDAEMVRNFQTRSLQSVYKRDSLYNGVAKSFTFDRWDPLRQGEAKQVEQATKVKQKALKMAQELSAGQNFNVGMMGGAGVGKTAMSLAIMDAVQSTRTVMFVSTAELAETMRGQFDDPDLKQRARYIEESMKTVDVLILDDFGTEVSLNTGGAEATNFIQRLYFRVASARDGKSTIVTTNETRATLEQMYNPKIISRLLTRDPAHQLNFTALFDLRQV